jgi:predicted HicB family RNase H-like nuclease
MGVCVKTSNLQPFGVRLQPDLKEWLAERAVMNHRSLNSELVKRLEDSRKAEESKHEAAHG